MMPCDSRITTWALGYSTNYLMDFIELTQVTDRPNGATHSTARATHSTGHRSLSEGLSAAILPRTKCSRRPSRPHSTNIRDLTAPASPSLRNSNSVSNCAPWRISAATTQPVLRSQCLESSHAHSTAERTGRSRCALQASRQPCAPSRHRSRRHSASPHARMRRWRVWRAKVAKTLLAQSPPLASRVDGRALVRRRAAQKVAEPPQARQSGCLGSEEATGTSEADSKGGRNLAFKGVDLLMRNSSFTHRDRLSSSAWVKCVENCHLM
jgi:hypothetical protein